MENPTAQAFVEANCFELDSTQQTDASKISYSALPMCKHEARNIIYFGQEENIIQ